MRLVCCRTLVWGGCSAVTETSNLLKHTVNVKKNLTQIQSNICVYMIKGVGGQLKKETELKLKLNLLGVFLFWFLCG